MQFTPKNRKDWRDWLRRNHDSKPEVWVVFFKKTSPQTNLSYNDAVEEALCFGWIDGVKRSIDEHRYMHRFSPRKPDSKWSPSNRERVRRMLESGASGWSRPEPTCRVRRAYWAWSRSSRNSCFTQSTSITHSPAMGASVILAKLRMANMGSG